MRYDAANDSYEPQLAQDVHVSDNQKTWTLTLREGAKFSDGSPVDASAVM
ncbi:ABC transporter substrate-binding protein [Tomitella biformata]|nr:ABC transporter substrate-binding protein [Tomitella biformata]